MIDAEKKKVNREKCASVLVAASFFACAFLSGGYFLAGTLPLYPCFILAFVLLIKNFDVKNALVFAIAVALCAVSLLQTRASLENGLAEVAKTLVFFLAFLLGTAFTDRFAVRKIICFVAFSVAVVGLLIYCLFTSNNEAVFLYNGYYRLQSVLCYANTTAIFLGCGYFAFLSDFAKSPSPLKLPIGMCILLATFLTVSKAGITVFIILATLYVKAEPRVRSVFVLQSIVSAIAALLMLTCTANGAGIAAFIICAFALVCSFITDTKKGTRCFRLWLFVLAVVTVAIAAAVICSALSLLTLKLRLIYIFDAIPLLKINPLFGIGPAAYREFVGSVQTASYSVSHIHCGILEFAVENGVLFALLFTLTVVYSFIRAFKKRLYTEAAMILLILLHSLIDVDLSFSSVLVVLGLCTGEAANKNFKTDKTGI